MVPAAQASAQSTGCRTSARRRYHQSKRARRRTGAGLRTTGCSGARWPTWWLQPNRCYGLTWGFPYWRPLRRVRYSCPYLGVIRGLNGLSRLEPSSLSDSRAQVSCSSELAVTSWSGEDLLLPVAGCRLWQTCFASGVLIGRRVAVRLRSGAPLCTLWPDWFVPALPHRRRSPPVSGPLRVRDPQAGRAPSPQPMR